MRAFTGFTIAALFLFCFTVIITGMIAAVTLNNAVVAAAVLVSIFVVFVLLTTVIAYAD